MSSRAPEARSVPGAVTVGRRGRVLTVRFSGEVDLALRSRLHGALAAVRQHEGPVELDLRPVTFFGAEGAGTLLAMVHARPRGTVTVVGTSGAVERTLRLCGVTGDVLPRRPGPASA